ncbi:MAG: PmoA family protein [Pirellulales bacterium]|nr:PmoA family protein [Pirellulales bacterium]
MNRTVLTLPAPCRVVAVGLVTLACLAVGAGPIVAAELTFEQANDRVVIQVDGQPFAEYLTKSGSKPIVWPIFGPRGQKMTRSFPMEKVKGEKFDHGHHRSLWFTHGSVDGVDFWAEGRGKGQTVHREFKRVELADGAVVVETVNDWVDAEGKKHLEDQRVLEFRAGDDWRSIDFDITLRAGDAAVVFGDTKEGTLGLRVPTVMDVDGRFLDEKKFRREHGDEATFTDPLARRLVNSRGQADGEAWGKPAEWVDYQGTVDGQHVGVAILNHPSSFRFPTYWHVRTYGLFAANPFGIRDFTGDAAADGSYTLPPGESITLRYRFLFHLGEVEQGHVAEAYEEYAKTPK